MGILRGGECILYVGGIWISGGQRTEWKRQAIKWPQRSPPLGIHVLIKTPPLWTRASDLLLTNQIWQKVMRCHFWDEMTIRLCTPSLPLFLDLAYGATMGQGTEVVSKQPLRTWNLPATHPRGQMGVLAYRSLCNTLTAAAWDPEAEALSSIMLTFLTHRNHKVIDTLFCFKPLCFAVICYTATGNYLPICPTPQPILLTAMLQKTK